MTPAERYQQHDWAALCASGQLAKLTVEALKTYLAYHHLAVGGRKSELVHRITDHLEQG